MLDTCTVCGKDKAYYTRQCKYCKCKLQYHYECLPMPTNSKDACYTCFQDNTEC